MLDVKREPLFPSAFKDTAAQCCCRSLRLFGFFLLLLLLLTSRVALQQMRMRRGMRHGPGEKFTDAGQRERRLLT